VEVGRRERGSAVAVAGEEKPGGGAGGAAVPVAAEEDRAWYFEKAR